MSLITSQKVHGVSGTYVGSAIDAELNNYPTKTITTNYTATDEDLVIICNNTTGITVTLPIALGSGQIYYIKSINVGSVDVTNATDTIDGETIQSIEQWDSMEVISSSPNNWSVL